LFFAKVDKADPMVATYRAKWDDAYREKWGISTGRAAALSEAVRDKIMQDSVSLFKILGLKGYARLDWRLTHDGEPVFLEANPNPALSQDDDFAKAAKTHGYAYGELIATIAQGAVDLLNHRDANEAAQMNPRCSATTRPIISKERSSA
jgi:D-alanine-D-alanine ligase